MVRQPALAGALSDEARPTPREGASLDPALLPRALALRDWLLATLAAEPGEALAGLAARLDELGVPVDRVATAVEALHAEYKGMGRVWTREAGASFRLFPHGPAAEQSYQESPFAEAHRRHAWLSLDLAGPEADRFVIAAELRAAGYRHYLCVPIVFSDGSANGVAFATRRPEGFDERALAVLRFVLPTLAAVLETRVLTRRLEDVLRTYVGDGPHHAILAGGIRRGQVSRIRSAILFADMRDYTRLTVNLTPDEAVDLLNGYFDCLVPPIEAEGGEVLKYLGDGLLAIFRSRGDDTGGEAEAALTAATAALAALDAANRAGRFSRPVRAGIALHHGEAAYGNVGSGSRLDFTVIGRDVNLAGRMAELNRTLGEPLLLSRAFVDHLWGDPEPLGTHPLQGFPDAVAVYRPRRRTAPPDEGSAAR